MNQPIGPIYGKAGGRSSSRFEWVRSSLTTTEHWTGTQREGAGAAVLPACNDRIPVTDTTRSRIAAVRDPRFHHDDYDDYGFFGVWYGTSFWSGFQMVS